MSNHEIQLIAAVILTVGAQRNHKRVRCPDPVKVYATLRVCATEGRLGRWWSHSYLSEEGTKGLRTHVDGEWDAGGIGRRGKSRAFGYNTDNKRSDPGQGENKSVSM